MNLLMKHTPINTIVICNQFINLLNFRNVSDRAGVTEETAPSPPTHLSFSLSLLLPTANAMSVTWTEQKLLPINLATEGNDWRSNRSPHKENKRHSDITQTFNE